MIRTHHSIVAGAALALALSAGAAQAQDPGLYISGGAGWSLPEDSDFSGGGVSSADLENGWNGVLGLGYGFASGFRGEVEGGYHRNNVDDINGVSAGGNFRAWSLMGNVYYDFRGLLGSVTPYVGAGLGGARVDANSISPVGASSVDDDDTSFAWQLMAGVAVPLAEQLDGTLGYRYFAAPNLDYNTAAGASIDADYRTHSIMVGLRYSFSGPAKPEPVRAAAPAPAPMAAPAPQPAPTPAPPPARQYLVFFDFDKTDLTQQAQAILQTAATNAKGLTTVKIRATGHADRAGSDAYNMRLSQRRADAVKAELVRLGIKASEIAVVARGETNPLVPTADGVREPQNRRVEIVFE
ncbi:MAG: OmpA family protein [Alphaproteobacteria bacterium]